MTEYRMEKRMKLLNKNLHDHVIKDSFSTSRPFEKIVELGLKAAVSRVASRGAVAERFAKKRHPRRRQPVAATLTLTATNNIATTLNRASTFITTFTMCN